MPYIIYTYIICHTETMHYFGNPRHTQSSIENMILNEYFRKFEQKFALWECCQNALLSCRAVSYSHKEGVRQLDEVTVVIPCDTVLVVSITYREQPQFGWSLINV